MSVNHDVLKCPECPHVETVSEEDPDSSYDDLLGHVASSHPDADQSPGVLWPRIELRSV